MKILYNNDANNISIIGTRDEVKGVFRILNILHKNIKPQDLIMMLKPSDRMLFNNLSLQVEQIIKTIETQEN